MKRNEVNCAIFSYVAALLGFGWDFIYAAGGNPHGNSAPQSLPLHLFVLPLVAHAAAFFVLFSTARRGLGGKGLLITLAPIMAAFVEMFLAVVGCVNAQAHS